MNAWRWGGLGILAFGLTGLSSAQTPSRPAPPPIGKTTGTSPENGPAGPSASPLENSKSDLQLVERLNAARAKYQASLEALHAHYLKNNEEEKARWAKEELLNFHRIPKQAFRLELDVPPPDLKPQENIVRANKLFRDAMYYKDKGYGTDYVDNQKRAELLLQQILIDHPESDKIGEVAYQLGDLYSGKAYKQYRRSALYFERSYQWNRGTAMDARIRAARIYDAMLRDVPKAVQLYKEVLSHETNDAYIKEAQERLRKLDSADRN